MNKPFSYHFYTKTAEAWDAMYQAILSAKKSIFWEIYIFVDDAAGQRFVDALCDKAKAGVDIKLIADSFGSHALSEKAITALAASGVDVKFFNHPLWTYNPWRWWRRLWKRNHRKVLIVDEETAFVGGVNVEADMADWDDIHVRVVGDIVAGLLRGFAKSYVKCGGKRWKMRRILYPRLTDDLRIVREKVAFIMHSPSYRATNNLKRLFAHALRVAKNSITILTPYYAPGKYFLLQLMLAHRRGVKINIILPERPDVDLMRFIGRSYFYLSQQVGADIYLLPNMNHGKAICVDNKVGIVGSINLTPRSFELNEEASVYFTDKPMVADLNKILEDWRGQATLVPRIDDNRPWYKRFNEWLILLLKDFV